MSTLAERKKLKVADLKALLSERGLDTLGLKAALLERLEDAIAKEEAAPAVPGEEQPEAVAEPDPSPQEMDVPEESPAPAPAEDPVPIASATTPAATKAQAKPAEVDMRKLFITSIPMDVTEDSLKAVISEYGDVAELKVVDIRKKEGKGGKIAFVTMATPEGAQKAIDGLHDKHTMGSAPKPMVVQVSKPKGSKDDSRKGEKRPRDDAAPPEGKSLFFFNAKTASGTPLTDEAIRGALASYASSEISIFPGKPLGVMRFETHEAAAQAMAKITGEGGMVPVDGAQGIKVRWDGKEEKKAP
eukprot:CAMPEP_0182901796 /NCGR_PEP_ID=MMETSP0034_2-20130328/29951_1 /TAXON_ID=156128 /ORGANISM="Nephroselmis pyriformis, Strain CCMP717" /LENGTH=300 /DNA_ID=CAMNT_0025036301 /DNA_START=26 /DNA_END=924 /DNA_ORIENTATION=-